MAEPNTSGGSLGALAVAAVGPVAGPYALIIAGAVIGSLWPLSNMELESRAQKRQGAFFMIRIVSLAVLVTSAGAYWVHDKIGLPVYDAMAIVSGIIGAIGDGWSRLIAAARDGLVAIFTRGGKSDGNS